MGYTFKEGDEVIIARERSSNISWTPSMSETVGKTGIITRLIPLSFLRRKVFYVEIPDAQRGYWYEEGCLDLVPSPQTQQAIKHDAGKPRYDLIPPEALDGLARLYALGAEKYKDRNWEKGMAWSRIFSALMRHAWKWFRGERYDAIDSQHHLLSVIWCAVALYTYDMRCVGEDDRPGIPMDHQAYDTFWKRDFKNEGMF